MANVVDLIVHATHEAGLKLGGIGAVLEGLLTTPAYQKAVRRSILAGPINAWNALEMERLFSPTNKLTVIYSTLWGHEANNAPWHIVYELGEIERRMNVRFLYGTRTFGDREVEVLLVDAGAIASETINSYKYHLWQRWGLPSAQHEATWEFSFYLNAGEPLFAALQVLTVDMPGDGPRFLIAHEWLGLPLAFSARLREDNPYKTVFYAHEVATARLLVESHGGQDTRFYNALRLGLAQGASLDEVFGDQSWYYKHAMLLRAGVCDRIFAVGDPVVEELRFLGGVFASAAIDLVYNGVPATTISLEQKLASRELLLQYAQNLFGARPDYIFTHVTRMIPSKALWRDVRVLEHLEWTLASAGKTAVFFIVATAAPAGRRSEDVLRWEQEYGWPVDHRDDNGDLVGDEAAFFFNVLQPFHWGRTATRIVLVNQFGWERLRCGNRMPAAMRFSDLRNGADLEFGQSVYEPFGIAQIEPLSAGAICAPSSVCGCVGFLRKSWGAGLPPAVVVGDYTTLPPQWRLGNAWDALRIDAEARTGIEERRSWEVAQQIWERLPHDEHRRQWLLAQGQRAAAGMSWDVVVNTYLLPALRKLY